MASPSPIGGGQSFWPVEVIQEARRLGVKATLTLLRVVVLAVMVGIHKFLDLLALELIPKEWPKVLTVMRVMFIGAFLFVYLHLLFEMVQVFYASHRVRTAKDGEET